MGQKRARACERGRRERELQRSTGTQGPSVLGFAWRCDRHAKLDQHPAPPQPGTQPSHGPQGHQAGARAGGVGLGVYPDTTQTPLPGSSLVIILCPTLRPWGGVRTGGPCKREPRKPWVETSPKERGPVLQQPLGTLNILPEGQGEGRPERESDPGAIWRVTAERARAL